MYYNNKSTKENNKSFGKYNNVKSIKLLYQKQIDTILDSQKETYYILSRSDSHLHILECNTKTDFENMVLRSIIQKPSIKRNLDIDIVLDIIPSKIIWENY